MEKSYNPIEAKTTKKGLIHHRIETEDGKSQTFHYSAVRGGLSWPCGESPAFYVILGEQHIDRTRYEGQPVPRGKLKVFAEREISSPFLDGLFNALTDDCVLYGCSYIYANLEAENKELGKLFSEYRSAKKMPYIAIEPAPFVNNFPLGVSLINRWLSEALLDLPEKSVVREQLKKLTKADFEDSPEQRFYAVNALRFVLGQFYKSPPSPGLFTIKRKIRPLRVRR